MAMPIDFEDTHYSPNTTFLRATVALAAMVASAPKLVVDFACNQSYGHSEAFNRWKPNSGPLPPQVPGNRAKRRNRHKRGTDSLSAQSPGCSVASGTDADGGAGGAA